MHPKSLFKELQLEFSSNNNLNVMLGVHSQNLKKISEILDVEIDVFGNRIRIYGEESKAYKAEKIFNSVYNKIEDLSYNTMLDFSIFENELNLIEQLSEINSSDLNKYLIKTWKKTIVPKSFVQKSYLSALQDYDLVFGIGPAGTGKSYLAVAKGIEYMKQGLVDKIILSRPAVEAGENLGFLPGDMKEKVDPYLRPIYDALYEMMPFEKVEKKIQNGEIEIAPLAFMRGRTFQNAFIIIDEAQNTTPIQMKMILTRIGKNSKMVVNGDLSQIDIPKGVESGLAVAIQKLRGLKLVKEIRFSEKDVVRHLLVKKIIEAYEKK